METVAAVSVAEQAAKNPLLFQKNLVALARKSMSLHNYSIYVTYTSSRNTCILYVVMTSHVD